MKEITEAAELARDIYAVQIESEVKRFLDQPLFRGELTRSLISNVLTPIVEKANKEARNALRQLSCTRRQLTSDIWVLNISETRRL